jgi:hypothetical protein
MGGFGKYLKHKHAAIMAADPRCAHEVETIYRAWSTGEVQESVDLLAAIELLESALDQRVDLAKLFCEKAEEVNGGSGPLSRDEWHLVTEGVASVGKDLLPPLDEVLHLPSIRLDEFEQYSERKQALVTGCRDLARHCDLCGRLLSSLSPRARASRAKVWEVVGPELAALLDELGHLILDTSSSVAYWKLEVGKRDLLTRPKTRSGRGAEEGAAGPWGATEKEVPSISLPDILPPDE